MEIVAPVIISILTSLTLFGLMVYVFSRGWVPVLQKTGLVEIAQIAVQKQEITKLGKDVERLTTLYENEQKERVELLKDLTNAYRKIATLEEQYKVTQAALHTLQAQFGVDGEKRMSVLGVWPQVDASPLDQGSEKSAIYNAGIAYTPLEREKANKISILRELRIAKHPFNILEVGAHGTEEGIILSDGVAEPGWWARILDKRPFRVVILLSCNSDSKTADAIISVGIPYVIAVDGEVEDAVAVNFIRAFYVNYADGMTTSDAYEYALLALSRHDADVFRLRQAKGDSRG